jgi:hypothetical protein
VGDAESSLGGATSSLGDATSSLGGAKSSLGDAKSSLGDTQLVNGIEVLLARLPRPVARAGTVAIRMTNNFIGARAFLALAGLSIFQM